MSQFATVNLLEVEDSMGDRAPGTRASVRPQAPGLARPRRQPCPLRAQPAQSDGPQSRRAGGGLRRRRRLRPGAAGRRGPRASPVGRRARRAGGRSRLRVRPGRARDDRRRRPQARRPATAWWAKPPGPTDYPTTLICAAVARRSLRASGWPPKAIRREGRTIRSKDRSAAQRSGGGSWVPTSVVNVTWAASPPRISRASSSSLVASSRMTQLTTSTPGPRAQQRGDGLCGASVTTVSSRLARARPRLAARRRRSPSARRARGRARAAARQAGRA